MMRPHFARRIAGSTAREHRNGPVTLTREHLLPFLKRIWSNGRISRRREDTGIVDEDVDAAIAFLDSSDHRGDGVCAETSVVTAKACPLSRSDLLGDRFSARRIALGDHRDGTAARKGCLAKTLPMPCPAPVMMTTRPFSEAKSACGGTI